MIDIKDLKILYDDIYDIALEIERVIDLNEFNKIEDLIAKKDVLIKKAGEGRLLIKLNGDEKIEIDNKIKKIKELDKSNVVKIKEKQGKITEKLADLTKSSKYISAYKKNNENEARLFDVKE